MTHHKVVIIGGGVAGLNAAKTLKSAGVNAPILEMSHRIGGRAYAEKLDQTWFDLGCSYLHEGAINPLVPLAESYGFALGKGEQFSPENTVIRAKGAVLEAESEALRQVIHCFDDKLVQASPPDCSLAELLDWDQPLSLVYAKILAGINASDVDVQSTLDYRQSGEGLDHPVDGSLGQLIATWGQDIVVQLNTTVEKVDWQDKIIRIATNMGTLTADKVVITASTGVLRAGGIDFTPALPIEHQQAINNLPCGVLNKIGVEFQSDAFDPDMAGWNIGYDFSNRESHIGTIDLNLSSSRPQAIVFISGRHGAYLERQGDAALREHACERLKDIFGGEVLSKITAMKATAWAGEPMTLGSYSYAEVGAISARRDLGIPIDERLFFAGEATNIHHYATCHGAFLAGRDVALKIKAALMSDQGNPD